VHSDGNFTIHNAQGVADGVVVHQGNGLTSDGEQVKTVLFNGYPRSSPKKPPT